MATFYLASSYSRREELQEYTGVLIRKGHKVTSRWLTEEHEIREAYQYSDNQKFAQEDLDDVSKAGILMLFTNPLSYIGRGGHHVETGIAIALKKHIIIIGPRVNVFHFLPGIEHHETFEEFLKWL